MEQSDIVDDLGQIVKAYEITGNGGMKDALNLSALLVARWKCGFHCGSFRVCGMVLGCGGWLASRMTVAPHIEVGPLATRSQKRQCMAVPPAQTHP